MYKMQGLSVCLYMYKMHYYNGLFTITQYIDLLKFIMYKSRSVCRKEIQRLAIIGNTTDYKNEYMLTTTANPIKLYTLKMTMLR